MNIKLNTNTKVFGRRPTRESYKVVLRDGKSTNMYVVRYRRDAVRPRIVLFDKETRLLDWCQKNEVDSAMGGGFFLRAESKPLGDHWISGVKQTTVPFIKPWHTARGTLYVTESNRLMLAPRYLFPQEPKTDLMQSGPLLVQNGKSAVDEGSDAEGFSEGAHQFDDDIAMDRFPRSAIATDDDYIYSVACDGYGPGESGMSFAEFADALIRIGAIDALNLDGGSSSTIINCGKLFNHPRGGVHDNFRLFKRGRPLYSAIIFDPA